MFAYMTQDLYTEGDLSFGEASVSGWVNPVWSCSAEYTYDNPADAGPISSVFDSTDGAYDPEIDGSPEDWKRRILQEHLGVWISADGVASGTDGDTFYGEAEYSLGYTSPYIGVSRAIHFRGEKYDA